MEYFKGDLVGNVTIKSYCKRHPEQSLDMESTHDVVGLKVDLTIEPCKKCESIKTALNNNLSAMAQSVQSMDKLRETLEGIQ